MCGYFVYSDEKNKLTICMFHLTKIRCTFQLFLFTATFPYRDMETLHIFNTINILFKF